MYCFWAFLVVSLVVWWFHGLLGVNIASFRVLFSAVYCPPVLHAATDTCVRTPHSVNSTGQCCAVFLRQQHLSKETEKKNSSWSLYSVQNTCAFRRQHRAFEREFSVFFSSSDEAFNLSLLSFL